MSSRKDEYHQIIIGQCCGIHGVRGWVKIFSYSRPREQIFSYKSWLIKLGSEWQEYKVVQTNSQGKNLIARLDGIEDREKARIFVGSDIAILREQLPQLPAGEYYLRDLISLQVVDLAGNSLGIVVDIKETGANDVLVVQGDQELLIPLLIDRVVKRIDKQQGQILLDWDPEYM